jgi:preprotein translocase subunit YajC
VNDLYSLLPIVLLLVIFYLLVMRPARARQRDYQATQGSLEPGRRVMLASGIYGELVSLTDTEAELRIAPSTVITVNRQAVAKVVDPSPTPDPESPND